MKPKRLKKTSIRKSIVTSNRGRLLCRSSVLIVGMLFCILTLALSAYAVFFNNIQTTNTIKTANFGLDYSFDSSTAETIYMGDGSLVKEFTESGDVTLAISMPEGNTAPTGFCIITVRDTDTNGEERTRTFFTGQIGEGGTPSFNLTLKVLSPGTVTFSPHWGTASNYGYLTENSLANNASVEIGTNNITYNTFDVVDAFVNTDKYLYRVGNKDDVALGSLFKVKTPGDAAVDASKVYITVESMENGSSIGGSGTNLGVGSNGKCTYTIDSTDDWKKSTLKFDTNGEGPVRVTIREGNGEPCVLNLEVVDGYNVTDYSQLLQNENKSKILLNDVEMPVGTTTAYTLRGATLYGNGFTFDVKNGPINGTGYETTNSVIVVSKVTLDNVNIVGKVYTEYGGTTGANYNRPCVLVTGGNCVISNSRISNCASPLRLTSNTNLTLKNTTLKGGCLCNMDIRSGSKVTIDNVTTINQVNSNDKADDDRIIVGLGIIVYYEGTNGEESITILNDSLKQYNYINENQSGNAISVVGQKPVDEIFTRTDPKFIKTDGNGVKWVNTGILSLDSRVGSDKITPVPGYDWQSIALLGKTSNLHTQLSTAYAAAPPFEAESHGLDAQYPVPPTYVFEYPTASGKKNYLPKTEGDPKCCYWDNTQQSILLGFGEGESFEFDPDILTLTKFGHSITAEVSLDGGAYQPITEKINISTAGEHTLTFRYADPYNYNKDGEKYGDVTYTKSVKITATAAKANINPASFKFVSLDSAIGTKTVTAGTNTYVMPDVNAAETGKIGSKAVSGQTIYYPLIYPSYTKNSGALTSTDGSTVLPKADTNTIFCPIFDGVVTITDYDDNNDELIYNGSTTTMADGKLDMISNKESVLKWASASAVPTDNPVPKSGKLYFQSATIQGVDRTASTYTFEYVYTDTAGNTYHYFVGYMFPKKEGGTGCVTPDTLITLTDGTQKRIDELQFGDKLLVWDFFNGQYTEEDISLLVNHDETLYEVLNLVFSDDTTLRLVGEHGVFDYDLNRFVYMTPDMVQDYIGHRFVQQGKNGEYKTVTLKNGFVTEEYTVVWSISSAFTYNAFASGMLTCDSPEDIYNWAPMGEKLHYDTEQLNADVEQYGLYTYDVFADYITYEQFLAYNGAYLKIPVEKGYFTFEYILELIDENVGWMP